jgi:hypothetical protein
LNVLGIIPARKGSKRVAHKNVRALAGKPLPARTIKLTRGWRIPCSAALITVCGTFALVGFPLDDGWHRLFGEDVTLWGPTHLLMIGGVVFSIFARLLALAEVEQLIGINKRRLFQEIVSVGALLIAWDLFSTEFNYGVPQFPLILQPILIVFGAALGFTILRARRGPGTTFAALAVYLVIRGGIAWAVAQPLGQIVGHFPLLIVEAVLVELVAFALGNKNRFRLGLVAGVLIGTVGVVAEYAWSHVWMPISWPSSMLPSALGYGVVVGAGAGLVGAWLATRYAEVAGDERAVGIRPVAVRRTHQFGAAGLIAVLAVLFFCVRRRDDTLHAIAHALRPLCIRDSALHVAEGVRRGGSDTGSRVSRRVGDNRGSGGDVVPAGDGRAVDRFAERGVLLQQANYGCGVAVHYDRVKAYTGELKAYIAERTSYAMGFYHTGYLGLRFRGGVPPDLTAQLAAIVLEVADKLVSRPAGFHHQPLSERCMRLSLHTAPIRRTCR